MDVQCRVYVVVGNEEDTPNTCGEAAMMRALRGNDNTVRVVGNTAGLDIQEVTVSHQGPMQYEEVSKSGVGDERRM